MHGVFFVRDSFNGATQSYEREEDNASKWSFWMYVKQISHANFVKEVQRWVLLRFWKRLFYSRKFVQETGSRSLKFNHKKFNQLWHCKPKFHLKKTSKLSRFNLCSYSCQISKEHKSRTKIEVNDLDLFQIEISIQFNLKITKFPQNHPKSFPPLGHRKS